MSVRGILTATVATISLAACGDAFSPEAVAGTYALVSINGIPLPATSVTVYEGEIVATSVSSGSLTLYETATYSLTTAVSFEWVGATVSMNLSDAGTYTLVEPSTIQFVGSQGNQFGGTLDGDRLTLVNEGASMVFER